MEGPSMGVVADVIAKVADGMAPGQCFNFNSDVLCRTSSYI